LVVSVTDSHHSNNAERQRAYIPRTIEVAKISDAGEKRLAEIMARYPDPKSGVMAALYIAQEELGFVTDEAVLWASQKTGLAPIQVREVATFYTMYYKRPVGKYHVQVCRTLSCALRGSKDLTQHLYDRFKVKPGEITADGQWSYEDVECLGSCGTAPMCQINDRYFENLSVDELEQILKKIETEQPALRFSTINDELGGGLSECAPSQIYCGDKI
jgi:NADH-quinone oxidoreductase E subunit